MTDLFTLLPSLLFGLISLVITASDVERCQSPQYLDIGTSGTINCDFSEDYFGIFWYDSANYSSTRPIISLKSSQKEGKGYDSGEFDILANGSLIISNVTLRNDHFFSVIVLHTTDEKPHSINVRVVVTVKPVQKHPIIEQCEGNQRICSTTEDHLFQLKCYVKDARPAVQLEWVKRTIFGDEQLHSEIFTTKMNFLTSSSVNTTYTHNVENVYVVFACMEKSFPPLLTVNESIILVQINYFERNQLQVKPETKFVHYNSMLSLNCTDKTVLYLTWKKVVNKKLMILESLIDTVFAEKRYDIIRNKKFKTGTANSLVLTNIQLRDEGLYVCAFGDGVTEHFKTFIVTMYVFPNPAFPMVEGCKEDRYCVLPVSRESTLTCTVRGIRPRVELEWRTFRESEASAITFSNHEHFVTSNEGDTFNVSLKSTFVLHGSQERLTVECKVIENGLDPWSSLHTQLDLLAKEADEVITYRNPGGDEMTTKLMALIVPLMIVSVIVTTAISVIIFAVLKHGNQRNRNRSNGRRNEEISLTLQELESAKEKLKTNLKENYRKSQKTTQPIPYEQKKWYSIKQCFVEIGVEYLRKGLQGTEAWERVDSYYNIFQAAHSTSKRAIIEAEPGYGKSTLCIQLTKDWCDPNYASPLANVDILILLRSRKINGNIKSFYGAIKELLLPSDSTMSEATIRRILEHYSTVVLLDGFDSYPLNSRTNIQLDEIMKGNILQTCLVIITTRSSCVRKEYPMEAERFRLRGFEANSRSEYIKKVITHSANEADKIEKIISTHPFLEDLCQVPLIFVHFSHMAKTDGLGTGVQIYTVTNIFQNIMRCFYHHMQYEGDGNVFENATFEYDHSKLDKLAFEGLKTNQISWTKKEMCEHLGEPNYDRYLSSGILVEEEFRISSENKGTLETTTKVRFYDKLFCEWYASNHLSQIASKATYEELEKQLQKMNPTDLQYVYRIACGLNEEAAAKIMRYVRTIKDGQQFEILCILEQPGKEDIFKDTVTNLCSARVHINAYDSRLLQRSTVQLLQIAANSKIEIKDLWLINMNGVADLSKKSFKFRQDLYLPNLETLQQLLIVDVDRTMSSKDLEDILTYSSSCYSLKNLRIQRCLLPQVVEKTNIPEVLTSKNMKVDWLLPHSLNTWYRLNLTSGIWQCEENDLSETEYANVKQDFDRLKGKTPATG